MKAIAYISMLLLAISCEVIGGDDSLNGHCSIASLRNIETSNRSVQIVDSFWLEGVVTANDKYGELYNVIIVEDSSAAVKILCEMHDNYRQYPFGARVRINCSGLYLLNHYGSLTLGAEPTDSYTVGNIAASALGIYLQAEGDYSPLEPKALAFESFTPLDVYRLVVLEDVEIVPQEGVATFCRRDPDSGRSLDTVHTLKNTNGSTFELHVDRLCAYGDNKLPEGQFSPRVIIDYYDQTFSATITAFDY